MTKRAERLRYRHSYNPIPDAFHRCEPELRQRFGIDPEQVVVGIVGNFRPVRGAPNGIEIFHGLVKSGVDAVLLMIGNAAEAMSFQLCAAELGILDRVIWVGRLELENLAPAYSSLDVLLHPSAHESFDLVLEEAARCQVPAVASDVGEIPEVVVDNETGFLCHPNDLDGFVARLSQLAADRPLRQRMGRAAEERAKELFDEPAVAQAPSVGLWSAETSASRTAS